MATGPELLLLDEIAGGLTEGECQALVATIRAHPRRGHHDHLDRACAACAEFGGRAAAGARLRAGASAIGAPGRRSWPRSEVREIYLGMEVMMALLRDPRPHRPLRRVPGPVRRRHRLDAGRMRGDHRRERRGQDHADARRSPACCATRRGMVLHDGRAIGALPADRRSCSAASPWCPRGAGCSPRCRSRKTC